MDPATELGLDWYISSTEAIKGELKSRPEDFRVEEISDFNIHDEGRQLVLNVELVDHETHRFARDLSNELRISRKRVSWAGTKDKKAVTTQLFTVDGVTKEEIQGINLEGVKLQVLGNADHPVGIGDLIGNRFVIRIRNASHTEYIDETKKEIEGYGGYPNLFDWQRFGSKRPITHRVGHHILAENYREAVDTYLYETHPDEPDRTRNARQRLKEEQDYKEALNYYPGHLGYEKALLNKLVEGETHEEALEALPRNLRVMFIHAVQSQVFNRALRERHQRGYSLNRALVGDKVCFTEGEIDGTPIPDVSNLQTVDRGNVDTINRHIDRNRCFITAPLVGAETTLGDSTMDQITREVMDEIGVSRRDFERDDIYGSRGHVRAALMKPDLDIEALGGDAAVFRFSLPKGSYATAVLREYLKDY